MTSSATLKHFEAIAKTLLAQPKVSVGAANKKGFGSSALQVDGKIFAMVTTKEEFVVKLPKTRVEALEAAGTGERFAMGGRLMKEWLVVDQANAAQWLALAKEALAFVGASKTT